MTTQNRDPKFNNKDGSLTRYAFACGYVEQHDNKETNSRVTLWLDCGSYHVRSHQFNGAGRLAWETFHTVKEARMFYKEQVKVCEELDKEERESSQLTFEELTKQAKTIMREGEILDVFERQKQDGLVTGRFVKWNGDEWFIRMKNGEVKSVRKLLY